MKTNEPERKYAAFISYRHVSPDKEIAKVLQFLLEYNLVRPNKHVPRHIRPVFLDTSELPTLEDLDAGILQALDSAECLFVICSPDLPKSKYCMREISYFKEQHGGSLDRVATLLVRGDPQDAYPALLRTKRIPDPSDPSKTVETAVEPLYADVRARTLIGSLWKLFTSEYLRLACRYFRCSYDVLKKRHKRNMIAFLFAALVMISGVTGALTIKEQQVQQTISDSYAAYANEQTQANNEFLALALCVHTDCKDTEAYSSALRSAVVQLDYKQRGEPVAKLLETEYFHKSFTNYFLSSTGNKLVIADGKVWQIIDAHNGAVLSQLPYESAFVLGKNPASYVRLEAHADEQGVFRDYVVLMDLETEQVITEFPFRESGGETPDYDVITDIETRQLHMLTDHGEPVAFFTSQGQPLTREEYVQQALEYTDDSLAETDAPYLLVKDKRKDVTVVKDRQGTVLLELGKEYQGTAFSDDYTLFAYAADGILTVYDTQTWVPAATTQLESLQLQSLHLLSGSSYYIAGYRQESKTVSFISDWRSGETLLTTDAMILTASGEPSFYTVQGGTICHYHYTDLETGNCAQVIAQSAERCLSGASGSYLLRDTAEDQVLLQTEAHAVYADESLETVLLQLPQGVVCCDGSGTVKWETASQISYAAMAPDGDCCAWVDEDGNVQVHRTSDGELLRCISSSALTAAGHIQQLVCSNKGIGVFGSEGALWLPKDSEEAFFLGNYTNGTLFSDGILILESSARVDDFRLYDTGNGYSFLPASDNTGLWAYSPKTGYLVRHIEASGNNPSLYLEVWARKGKDLSLCGRLELSDNRVEALHIDSTGRYLSVVSDGRSRVCRLEDLVDVLDTAGRLYYEMNTLYGLQLYGNYQYQMPMYDTAYLRQWAKDALTSSVGTRTLTAEEVKQYSIFQ